MKAVCEKLKRDIEKSANGKFDPSKRPFQPKDLGLTSSNYGSFSDHCEEGTTKSSKWCGCGLLRQTERQKPFKYILIK